MLLMPLIIVLTAVLTAEMIHAEPKQWRQGVGWGWVWGEDDEVGALNEMTAQSVLAALSIVERGQVRDLGVDYDRRSQVARTLARRNHDFPLSARRQSTARSVLYTTENGNTSETTWHSCALFMNDNVATQIDGLGHAVTGEDNHCTTVLRKRSGAAIGACARQG